MNTPAKIRIAVLFGGRSGEHEVSLGAAESVLQALDPQKYEAVPIAITHEGRWLSSGNPMKLLSPKETIQKELADGKPAAISAEVRTEGGFDVVFPVLHGTYGEDGTIQGLLKLADLPFVGAGVLGSAVGMDKDVMKRLLRDAKIPTPKFLVFEKRETNSIQFKTIKKTLGLPFFVKPANLGSSVGISKVSRPSQFRAAIDD